MYMKFHQLKIVALISLALFGVVFNSCQKAFNMIVDVDIPHKPMLAIEYNVTLLDSAFGPFLNPISISPTAPLTTPGNIMQLSTAIVKISENGILVDSFGHQFPDGYQPSFTNYKPGNLYTLKVEAPGYESVESTEIVPGKPEVQIVSLVKNARRLGANSGNNSMEWYDEIKLKITDNAASRDFYTIDLYRADQGGYTSVCKVIQDPVIDEEIGGDEDPGSTNFCRYRKLYIQDVSFNGLSKELTILAANGNFSQEPSLRDYKWLIYLENLSESAYKFERTKQLYDFNDGNPFAEPVQIYNNIKNGVGIFSFKHVLIDSLQ